jgi:3-oxoacyl-[acyl-carrier-protein] synthase II
MADVKPGDVGHVNAHGLSTELDDRIEAGAIRRSLGDVPVTAPKSLLGNIGPGSGAVELAVSLLSFEKSFIPPTLNYNTPDPKCPINVIRELTRQKPSAALVLNHRTTGQAVSLLITAD